MSNPLPAAQDKFKLIRGFVSAREPDLAQTLEGTGLSLPRFMALAWAATRKNPDLLKGTPESWFNALQTAATHGLLPDGIHGALVPYGTEVTFQAMFQGLVQRAYQTKAVDDIWGDVIYRGEKYKVQRGTDPKLEHEPGEDRGDPSKLVATYACAIVGGRVKFEILYRAEVMRHKASSRAAKSGGPWKDHEAEMWKKTAIIVLSKTLPHFHAEAQKFADLVHEDERADIIDITSGEVLQEARPEKKAPLQDAKERLKATAPKPASSEPPAEDQVAPSGGPEEERQAGDDSGDTECPHAGLVELAQKGVLTAEEPPPACAQCGLEMDPGALKAFLAQHGPKPKAQAAAAPSAKACAHPQLVGRAPKPAGKLHGCPNCDAELTNEQVAALGKK